MSGAMNSSPRNNGLTVYPIVRGCPLNTHCHSRTDAPPRGPFGARIFIEIAVPSPDSGESNIHRSRRDRELHKGDALERLGYPSPVTLPHSPSVRVR